VPNNMGTQKSLGSNIGTNTVSSSEAAQAVINKQLRGDLQTPILAALDKGGFFDTKGSWSAKDRQGTCGTKSSTSSVNSASVNSVNNFSTGSVSTGAMYLSPPGNHSTNSSGGIINQLNQPSSYTQLSGNLNPSNFPSSANRSGNKSAGSLVSSINDPAPQLVRFPDRLDDSSSLELSRLTKENPNQGLGHTVTFSLQGEDINEVIAQISDVRQKISTVKEKKSTKGKKGPKDNTNSDDSDSKKSAKKKKDKKSKDRKKAGDVKTSEAQVQSDNSSLCNNGFFSPSSSVGLNQGGYKSLSSDNSPTNTQEEILRSQNSSVNEGGGQIPSPTNPGSPTIRSKNWRKGKKNALTKQQSFKASSSSENVGSKKKTETYQPPHVRDKK